MKKCIWLGMMSGLCYVGVMARADAPPPVVGAPVALPTGDLQVDASDAGTSAVWEALQKGKMTPEEAWQKGLLDVQAVQAGLSQGLAGGEDDNSRKLRLALGGVLVQHAPEVVKDTLKLTRQVQFALADYYASIGDERAAPLYEAVLKQTDQLREQGLVILQLGNFWTQQGQPQKAQDTYERGRKALTGKDPYFAGEMVIMAARAWARNGDSEKARLLYAQVEREGDPWMRGMATEDQSLGLQMQNRLAEAIQLLHGSIVEGTKMEFSQTLVFRQLAWLYLRQGDSKSAYFWAQKNVSLLNSLKDDHPNNFREQQQKAQETLLTIQRWETFPLICDPPRFHITVWPKNSRLYLVVQSLQPVDLIVTSSNPLLLVQVPSRKDSVAETDFAQQVQIILDHTLQTQDVDAVLSIRSSKFPGFVQDVPIHLLLKQTLPFKEKQ